MVDCASLENWRAERFRGFESHPLRQDPSPVFPGWGLGVLGVGREPLPQASGLTADFALGKLPPIREAHSAETERNEMKRSQSHPLRQNTPTREYRAEVFWGRGRAVAVDVFPDGTVVEADGDVIGIDGGKAKEVPGHQCSEKSDKEEPPLAMGALPGTDLVPDSRHDSPGVR